VAQREPVEAAAAPEPTAAKAGPHITRLIEVTVAGTPARRPAPNVVAQQYLGPWLALELACPLPFEERRVLGACEMEGMTLWACFDVRSARALQGERWRVELAPASGANDLLRERALLPTLDPASMRYQRPALGEHAREWVEMGVVREVELDRVLVCPRCQALPTFRLACRRCASARIEPQRLIHHFPCAHVGFIKDYQLDGALVCPKCAARPLIVNSDFEYLEGPSQCAECGSHESEGELVGHCFGCGLRFLARVATTLTLKGFDVDRLDPLALGLSSD
jgi:hypothetical protein